MGGVGPLVAVKGDPAADARCGQVFDPDGTSFELVAYDTRGFMEDDQRNPYLTLTTDERLAELAAILATAIVISNSLQKDEKSSNFGGGSLGILTLKCRRRQQLRTRVQDDEWRKIQGNRCRNHDLTAGPSPSTYSPGSRQ